MKIEAKTVDEYISKLPQERQEAIKKLREIINKNIPKGFHEEISYGGIGWVVPHSIYPDGYHCDPKLPLPFMGLMSQKNFISLYHMGIYSDEKLKTWFEKEYKATCKTKLDMGKSCIRLKKIDDIPYDLIGQLASKMTPQEWINIYEEKIKP